MLEELNELYKITNFDHCCEPEFGPKKFRTGQHWMEEDWTGPASLLLISRTLYTSPSSMSSLNILL